MLSFFMFHSSKSSLYVLTSHFVHCSFYKPYFLKLKLLSVCVMLPNWLWYPHVAAWPKALVFLVSLSSKANVNWEEFFSFFFPLAKIWTRLLALRNNAESSFLPHIYHQCPAFFPCWIPDLHKGPGIKSATLTFPNSMRSWIQTWSRFRFIHSFKKSVF